MRFLKLVTVTAHILSVIHTGVRADWLNHLHDSLNKMKPYQITIYENKNVNGNAIKMKDILYQKLAKSFPTTVIKLSEVDVENRVFLLDNIKATYSSGLVIFLQLETDVNNSQIINFINFYEKIFPKQPRQKCLVICSSKNSVPESSVKKIFQLAWQKKFLDFIVLDMNTNSNEEIFHSFNPFFNKTNIIKFSVKVELFPKKLLDLNKYPFIMPIYSHEPYVNLVKDSAGKLSLKNFMFDSLLFTILEEMNFKVKYLEIDFVNKHGYEIYLDNMRKLENHKINMELIPGLTTLLPQSLPFLFLNTNCFTIIGVMKNQSRINFDICPNILIFFASMMAFIIFSKCIFIYLPTTAYNFEVLDVLRIIVAMPLTSLPKTSSKRIITSIALVFSVLLSGEFTSILTKFIQVKTEISLNSIDEIYRSEYQLITSSSTYRSIRSYLDVNSKNLFNQKVKVDDSIQCPYFALKNEKMICLLSSHKFKFALKKSEEIIEVTKILPFNFLCTKPVYIFEKASPYMKRFKQILQRLQESGIFDWLSRDFIPPTFPQFFKNTENEEVTELLKRTLMLICFLGTGISLAVFIVEIIFYQLLSNFFRKILSFVRLCY